MTTEETTITAEVQERTTQTQEAASAHEDTDVDVDVHEHEPHMPAPSLSPIILAVGMTLVVFGLVFGPIVIAIGAIGILVGLGTWLYDEIKNANASTPAQD